MDQLCEELIHHLDHEQTYPPPAGQRAWDWFWELDKGRQVGFAPNAISWSDIVGWQIATGAEPELWELNAIYRMGMYRIDPDFDPLPKKQEPPSIIQSLKRIQDSNKKAPYGR